MKPTKRQSDPLGRSTTRHRYSRYLLSLAIAITGSVWPIQARSMEPILDTKTRGEQLLIAVDAIEALDDRRSILSVLSSLLAAAGRGVHVVVTCRATTWNELRSSQSAIRGWRVAELTDWPTEVVAEVVQANCSEPPQQLSLALLELLRTPLFLDLFLRITRGASGSTPRTSSRLELLTAYWQQRILPSGDSRSLPRAELLREVSQPSMGGIEHHRLPKTASSEAALRELASEGLFTIAGRDFHFRHALLRDFALAQLAAETASPLRVVCAIQSHVIRLGALEFWLEAEVSVEGGVARLGSELERLEPKALVDVASSLGQLGNAGRIGLLELTSGMQPDSAHQLMAHGTRWARLAGNGSWLTALASLPAHAAWAERTSWLDGELIQQLLDLVETATANDLAPAATRGLAEAIREWLDAPKFAPALADHNGWLQGHAISIIGRAAPTDDTLRWFIRRGKLADAARTMITGTLLELVTRTRDRLSPALVVEASLVGAGLRWLGRRLAWDDKERQDWRGLRPYLLGEGMRWPGWLEACPEEFVPVAVALLAGVAAHAA